MGANLLSVSRDRARCVGLRLLCWMSDGTPPYWLVWPYPALRHLSLLNPLTFSPCRPFTLFEGARGENYPLALYEDGGGASVPSKTICDAVRI